MKLELYKEIRQYLKKLIQGTKFENKVYCVGGCCRDEILGNEIKDIDIVIELPEGGIEFANWLYNNHYTKGHVQSYPRFGTAMFHLRKYPTIEIEAVNTRCEKYLDGTSRNPETDYGTIYEDCYRRDLTINALYYNISKEEFLDVCNNSISDIKNHVICTPYNPDITYTDDPLRILRCVRFATRYKWNIENQTYLALKRNIGKLCILTAERITDEFMKILSDDNYFHGLNILEDIGALKYILSPFNLYTWNNRTEHFPILYTYNPYLMISPLLDNVYTRLVVLLYPYKQYADQIMRMRKMSIATIKYINNLIRLYDKYSDIFCDEVNDKNIRRCQYDSHSKEMFDDFLKILFVFKPHIYPKFNIYNKEIHNHFEYKLPINGDDIIEYFNIPPGKQIKNFLDQLIELSFKKPDLTKEDCIAYIKESMT